MNESGYPNGRAFVQALKASAKSTHPHAVQQRIQQLWFDCFLCRVFAFAASIPDVIVRRIVELCGSLSLLVTVEQRYDLAKAPDLLGQVSS